MASRKRPHAALQEEDEEEDELALNKSDILPPTESPLANSGGTAKKRKLNTNTKGFQSLKKRAGNLFLGKGKDGEGGKDGLVVEPEEGTRGKGIAAKGKGRGKVKDLFDLPTSGEDEVVGRKKEGVTPRSVGKAKAKTPKVMDIFEVPDSDEEVVKVSARRTAGSATKKGLSTGRANMKEPVDEEEATPKSTRKTSTTDRGRKASSPSAEADLEEAEPPKSSGKKSVRGRKAMDLVRGGEEGPVSTKKTAGRGRKAAKVEAEPEQEEKRPPQPTCRKGIERKKAELPIPSPTPPPAQPVAKKRGRPRKNIENIIQDATGTPKGILTPSKARGLKSKKSVAFEYNDGNIDLGFKDIPVTASVKKSKKIQVEHGEGKETKHINNKHCGVCEKTRRRFDNEMILCDGCEFAVHMKCYDLESLPEGHTWYCKTCRPEDFLDEGEVEAEEELEIEEEEELATVPGTIQTKLKKGEKAEICCAICSGLESKHGNHIIICDGCEFAVHIKCYSISTIPKGDWFCRTCLAAAGEDPFNLGIEDEVAVVEANSDLPDIEDFDIHLRRAQRVILDQLTGRTRIKMIGHDEEMQKVYQVVEQTILAGEGNSMLVIGARGCGKTTLVESVIANLAVEHKDNFHVVRLNGFVHTDDKIASKEIWRQLGKEMDTEDDAAGKPSNYADTLASLLALLSHPSENSEEETDHTAKSVIFILDEFDLFTGHSRQTLLYNLFDIAQARKAPIVVLGLTTRVDVVESLEKRVKSRFSHRYVHLSLPRSIPSFWQICKQGLTISPEDFTEDSPGASEFLSFWAGMINDLYTKDPPFKQHILSHFFRTKSVPAFFSSSLLPLTLLTPTTLPLKLPSLTILPLTPPDSKLHTLQGLSELSLALLISAARLDIILDTDTCNFAMVYDEYSSLTSRHKIQTSSSGVNALGSSAKVWGKDVALECWERLQDGGLLVAAGGGMWKVDVGLEEIAGSVEGLSAVMGKWCREI